MYVRAPNVDDLREWDAYDWRSEPDGARAANEHAALREELGRAGAIVETGSARTTDDPDAIFAYDPALMTDAGVILLNPGKVGRRNEPDSVASDFAALGIPIVGRLEPPATAEGGDLFWLDGSTLLAGRSYRTNGDGIAELRRLLGDSVDVIAFDLPHFHGPNECLHLMSFISPLDVDLVVGYVPMMPVRLVELLEERGIGIVEVPDDELMTLGPNVLALGPRIALALDGNRETRRRMEAAGVDVRTYVGNEISLKGEGGPTCLTQPLERG